MVEIGESGNKKWPLIMKVANGADWRQWQQEAGSDHESSKWWRLDQFSTRNGL